MLFDGPYGVYHSVYDDFEWMSRFGDPTFGYHATMARLWGILALRFADADVVPLDYSLYPREIAVYLRDLEKIAPVSMKPDLESLIQKCQKWQAATAEFASEAEQFQAAQGKSGQVSTAVLNEAVMSEERALLIEHGIPGRPWFRHLIYAPLPSYEAETLPGLREALVADDNSWAHTQAQQLGTAIDRATAALARSRNAQGSEARGASRNF
jgi:N-acetylated-alpha-linked acidic dipeptidase